MMRRAARLVPRLAAALFAVAAVSAAPQGAAQTPAPSGDAAAATISHGVSAFGDLKYPVDFAHFDYVHPDAPKGGEIKLRPSIANRTFDNFNIYISRGDAADGSQYLFDSLMARAYDEPDALYGLIAESIELPAERSFAVFNLRAEARFADGSPVTAEDVAWSVTTLREKGSPRVAIQLRDVAAATVLGPLRVRFDFAEGAAARDLPATVAEMPIFSKAAFEGRDFAEPDLEKPPLGSGPYRVGPYQQGRTVTYELRDDYWARDLPVRRGQYNFGKLTYEYFLNDDASLEAFKVGAITFDEVFSSLNWATKYDFPALTNGWVIKETLPDGRAGGTQGYFWNTRRAKFADRRTREALGLAFDFEWANQRLFYGLYQRTDSYFENTNLQPEGLPSAAEQALLEPFRGAIPDAAFGEPVMPSATDGSGQIRGNLRRATRLLEEAGWRLQERRLVDAAGEPFVIEFLDRAGSAFGRITRPFIQNLELLGIDARIREVDPAQYESLVRDFEFDVAVARLPLGQTPGPALRGYLGSEARDAPDSFNLAGVASPAIDAMIDRIASAASREELTSAARALDRVFRAEHYWTPNWTKASHTVVYWDRFGRPQDLGIAKPPFDRGVIATWWHDAEKSAALDARMGR